MAKDILEKTFMDHFNELPEKEQAAIIEKLQKKKKAEERKAEYRGYSGPDSPAGSGLLD